MRTEAINIDRTNTNFNAKLTIIGGPPLSKKPQKLLPKNALQRLEQKANAIGTDKDTIIVGLCNSYVSEPEPNLFLNMLGVPTYRIKEKRTKVTLHHCFPGKSIDEPTEKFICGSTQQQKISAYKTIWKYLDSLQEKFTAK